MLVHYGGYILSSFGALLGVSLLSHLVPADIYGKAALYIAIATLFQNLAREALSNALMRHAEQIRQNKYVALATIKKACPSLLVSYVVICSFCLIWIDQQGIGEIFLSIVLIALFGLTVTGEAFLSALLKRGAYAVHLNMIQWLRFLLAGFFYSFVSQTISSVLSGFTLAFLMASIFDFVIWKRLKPPAQKMLKTYSDLDIFKGVTPVLIGFFVWVTLFYDRLAMDMLHGQELLGVYFVLIQIAYMPMVVFMRSSANFIFPLLYSERSKEIKKSMVGAIVILLGLAWILLFFLHEWIFSWLVGPQFREYSWLVPWIFLSAVLNAFSYLAQAWFYKASGMGTLLWIKGFIAFLYVVFITLFAWLYAIPGIVLANVIVSAVLLFLSLYFGKHKNFGKPECMPG